MPSAGVYLAFDFGMKRIGSAVGQLVTRQAKPLTNIAAKDGVPDWHVCDKLMATWDPEGLVVGLPLNMDGSEQWTTEAAKDFASSLGERYDLPVHLSDERLTTKAAKEHIFEQGGFSALKKADIDSVAAAIILQHWLERHDR